MEVNTKLEPAKSPTKLSKQLVNGDMASPVPTPDEDLKSSLMRLMIGDDLRIKVQYMDERSALNLMRPVNFKSLEQYFEQKYRRHLNLYYTTSSRELMIQIKVRPTAIRSSFFKTDNEVTKTIYLLLRLHIDSEGTKISVEAWDEFDGDYFWSCCL